MFSAKELMTTDIVSVTPDTTIAEAIKLLEHSRVSGLPVVDSRRRMLGLISEYDLLRSISGLQMRGKVADFMTTGVVTVGENASLAELADLFISRHVRRVPVTSDDKLVGVISRRDLIFAANVRQQLIDLPLVGAPAE